MTPSFRVDFDDGEEDYSEAATSPSVLNEPDIPIDMQAVIEEQEFRELGQEETLEQLNVSNSIDQLKEDIEKAKKAMEHFLVAQFDEAERLLRAEPEIFTTSLYLNLGVSFISFVKSLFTFEQEDIAQAQLDLERAMLMARKMKKSLTGPNFAARLYNAFARRTADLPKDDLSGRPLKPGEVEELLRHAELVDAETSLMLTVVRIFGEPDGMNYRVLLTEAWNIRKQYIYYRGEENRLQEAKSSTSSSDEFLAGIRLGNGIINVLFSMMPPSIFKVFSFIGYTGDGPKGIEELQEAANASALVSPLAQIILLLYYTILTGSFASSSETGAYRYSCRIEAVQALLEPLLAKYPTSPIFLFFLGRSCFLQHDVPGAIQAYTMAIEQAERSWPAFRYVIDWELILGNMRELNWEKCLVHAKILAANSRWSLVFCGYLEAIFRDAVARDYGKPEDLTEPIQEIFESLPKLERRIAGRAFPMERFIVLRTQAILNGDAKLYYAEFELMTLWDSFSYMDQAHLQTAYDVLHGALLNVDKDEDWVNWALLRLALASVQRIQGNLDALSPDNALPLLQSILDDYDPAKPLSISYVHILPLAHVEMAATLLALEQKSEAKKHLNIASKWKEKYYLDRSIQVRCSKLAPSFKKRSVSG